MNKNVVALIVASLSTLIATAILVSTGKRELAAQVGLWFFIAVAFASAFILFRDLADASQFVLETNRELTMWTWFNRKKILSVSVLGVAAAVGIGVLMPGILGVIPAALMFVLWVGLIFTGTINPGLMMRARQDNGRFVSIQEAKAHVAPDETVVVVEMNGEARAHPDKQLVRPHVAGGKPLGGQDVVMTYCGLTNLGIAVTPEVEGQRLQLRPIAQLHNNLVLADEASDQPIQQLWLTMEKDVNAGRERRLKQWPSFRMPFAKFELAYPSGEVFLNDYRTPDTKVSFFKNPFLASFDSVATFLFDWTLEQQQTREKALFPSVTHTDTRLPSKEKVWAVNVGDDYVVYTEAFVREQDGPINVKIGRKDVVVAYDEQFESLGLYYNNAGSPITEIDFFGNTAFGRMPRVETVKAGPYWIVWSHFFKDTEINRI